MSNSKGSTDPIAARALAGQPEPEQVVPRRKRIEIPNAAVSVVKVDGDRVELQVRTDQPWELHVIPMGTKTAYELGRLLTAPTLTIAHPGDLPKE